MEQEYSWVWAEDDQPGMLIKTGQPECTMRVYGPPEFVYHVATMINASAGYTADELRQLADVRAARDLRAQLGRLADVSAQVPEQPKRDPLSRGGDE